MVGLDNPKELAEFIDKYEELKRLRRIATERDEELEHKVLEYKTVFTMYGGPVSADEFRKKLYNSREVATKKYWELKKEMGLL